MKFPDPNNVITERADAPLRILVGFASVLAVKAALHF